MRIAQELFDTVAAHLLRQGRQSRLRGRCAYRGDDGLKCAIGCLISDEDYKPEFEDGTAVWEVPSLRRYTGASHRETAGYFGLLHDLQRLHDHLAPRSWRNCLRNLAGCYGLKFTVDVSPV